jgi:hypothetical protein
MTGALMSENNVPCLFSFDHRGIVHYEFAPEGHTINQDCYLVVLRCLQEAGSDITIMHLLTQRSQLDNSWQNIQFLPFHNPTIHLTSPLPTSFCSLNPKLPLKEDFKQ